jgi:hypothetical protein
LGRGETARAIITVLDGYIAVRAWRETGSCEVIPDVSLRKVLLYASPIFVSNAEVVLGIRISLLGRFTAPVDGLHIVAGHTFTLSIH